MNDTRILSVESVAVFLLTVVLVWYLYYLYCFQYWKKRGLPTPPPRFPAGNITAPMMGQENLYVCLENHYNDLKKQGHKHAGIYFFNGPIYFPIDTEIVKNILTTDFDHFVDRGMFLHEEKYPLSAHLFSIEGNKWKNLRAKLSPTFTSGKLKSMYEIFEKNTVTLMDVLEPKARTGEELNIKYVLMNYTADIIGTCAFGLECNTMRNPEAEFAQMLRRIFNPSLWLVFKAVMEEGMQNPGNILKIMASDKTVEHFFTKVVKDTVKYRQDNKIVRNDFLSLLLEVQEKEGLGINEMIAQTFLFFLAGFETSSSTMSYCVHELAHNQQLQDKLRKEVVDNLGKDHTKYTYNDILKLTYLDKVIKETLRLYPVVGTLNRICVKDYKVHGTDVVIKQGTPVIMSMLGLQRDPEYFPNPLRFDPERFDENNSIVPFSYLPFGEGPRICIGLRFGYLQTKLAIAALVSQFKFLPSSKTPKLIEFDKIATALSMGPKYGLFTKITKL